MTVRSLIWNGQIKHLRFGKKFVIPVEELRKFVREQEAS